MRHLEEAPKAPHRSRGIMHVLSDDDNDNMFTRDIDFGEWLFDTRPIVSSY